MQGGSHGSTTRLPGLQEGLREGHGMGQEIDFSRLGGASNGLIDIAG